MPPPKAATGGGAAGSARRGATGARGRAREGRPGDGDGRGAGAGRTAAAGRPPRVRAPARSQLRRGPRPHRERGRARDVGSRRQRLHAGPACRLGPSGCPTTRARSAGGSSRTSCATSSSRRGSSTVTSAAHLCSTRGTHPSTRRPNRRKPRPLRRSCAGAQRDQRAGTRYGDREVLRSGGYGALAAEQQRRGRVLTEYGREAFARCAQEACMGSRSRLRPGTSVSSKSSMTIERYSRIRGSRLRLTPAARRVAEVRSMKSSKRIAGRCQFERGPRRLNGF